MKKLNRNQKRELQIEEIFAIEDLIYELRAKANYLAERKRFLLKDLKNDLTKCKKRA